MDHPSFKAENGLHPHRSKLGTADHGRADLYGGPIDRQTERGEESDYYMAIIVQLLEALGYDVETIASLLGLIGRKDLDTQIQSLEDSKILSHDLADRLKRLHGSSCINLKNGKRAIEMNGSNRHDSVGFGRQFLDRESLQNTYRAKNCMTSPKIEDSKDQTNLPQPFFLQQARSPHGLTQNDIYEVEDLLSQLLIGLEGKLKGEAYSALLGCKQLAAPQFLSSLRYYEGSLLDLTGLLTAARRSAGAEAVHLLEMVLKGQSLTQSWEESVSRIASSERRVQDLLRENVEYREKLYKATDEIEKSKRSSTDLKKKLEEAMTSIQNQSFGDSTYQLKTQIDSIASRLRLQYQPNNHLDTLSQIERAMERAINTNMRLQATIQAEKGSSSSLNMQSYGPQEAKMIKLEQDLSLLRRQLESTGPGNHHNAGFSPPSGNNVTSDIINQLNNITKDVQREIIEIKEREKVTKYLPIHLSSQNLGASGRRESISQQYKPPSYSSAVEYGHLRTEHLTSNQFHNSTVYDQTTSNRVLYVPPVPSGLGPLLWNTRISDQSANLAPPSSNFQTTVQPSRAEKEQVFGVHTSQSGSSVINPLHLGPANQFHPLALPHHQETRDKIADYATINNTRESIYHSGRDNYGISKPSELKNSGHLPSTAIDKAPLTQEIDKNNSIRSPSWNFDRQPNLLNTNQANKTAFPEGQFGSNPTHQWLPLQTPTSPLLQQIESIIHPEINPSLHPQNTCMLESTQNTQGFGGAKVPNPRLYSPLQYQQGYPSVLQPSESTINPQLMSRSWNFSPPQSVPVPAKMNQSQDASKNNVLNGSSPNEQINLPSKKPEIQPTSNKSQLYPQYIPSVQIPGNFVTGDPEQFSRLEQRQANKPSHAQELQPGNLSNDPRQPGLGESTAAQALKDTSRLPVVAPKPEDRTLQGSTGQPETRHEGGGYSSEHLDDKLSAKRPPSWSFVQGGDLEKKPESPSLPANGQSAGVQPPSVDSRPLGQDRNASGAPFQQPQAFTRPSAAEVSELLNQNKRLQEEISHKVVLLESQAQEVAALRKALQEALNSHKPLIPMHAALDNSGKPDSEQKQKSSLERDQKNKNFEEPDPIAAVQRGLFSSKEVDQSLQNDADPFKITDREETQDKLKKDKIKNKKSLSISDKREVETTQIGGKEARNQDTAMTEVDRPREATNSAEELAIELEEANKKVKKLKKEAKKRDAEMENLRKALEEAIEIKKQSSIQNPETKIKDQELPLKKDLVMKADDDKSKEPQKDPQMDVEGGQDLQSKLEASLRSQVASLQHRLEQQSLEAASLEQTIELFKASSAETSKLLADSLALKELGKKKDHELEDLRAALSLARQELAAKVMHYDHKISQKDSEIADFKKLINLSKAGQVSAQLVPKGGPTIDTPAKQIPSPTSDRESRLDESQLFHLSKDSDRHTKDVSFMQAGQSEKSQAVLVEQLQKQIHLLKAEAGLKDATIAELQLQINTQAQKLAIIQVPQASSKTDKLVDVPKSTSKLQSSKTKDAEKASSTTAEQEIIEELATLFGQSQLTERESKGSKSKSQSSKREASNKQQGRAEQPTPAKVLEQAKSLHAKAAALEADLQQKMLECDNLNKRVLNLEQVISSKSAEIEDLRGVIEQLHISNNKQAIPRPTGPNSGNLEALKRPDTNLDSDSQVSNFLAEDDRQRLPIDSLKEFLHPPTKLPGKESSSYRDSERKPPVPPKNMTSADISRKEGDKAEGRKQRGSGMEHQNTVVSFPGTDDSQFQVNELLEDIKKLQEAKDKLQGMVEQLLKSEEASKILNEKSQNTLGDDSPIHQGQTSSLKESPINKKDSVMLETTINVDHLEQKIYDKLNLISQLQERIQMLERENQALKEATVAAKPPIVEEKTPTGGKSSKTKGKTDHATELKKISDLLPGNLQDQFRKMDEDTKKRLVQTTSCFKEDLDKATRQDLIASEVRVCASLNEKDIQISQLKSQLETAITSQRSITSDLIEARRSCQHMNDLQAKLEETKLKYKEVQDENRNMIEALEEIRQQINDGRIIIKDEQVEEHATPMIPRGTGGSGASQSGNKAVNQKKMQEPERTSVSSLKAKSSTKSAGQPKQGSKREVAVSKSLKGKDLDSQSDFEGSKSGRVPPKVDKGDGSHESDAHELMRQTTAELIDLQHRYTALQEKLSQQAAAQVQIEAENKDLKKELEEFKLNAIQKDNIEEIKQLQAIEAQMLDDAKTEEELILENAELIEFLKKANGETHELKERYIETVDYLDKSIKNRLPNEGSNDGFLEALDQEQDKAPQRNIEQLKQFNHGLWEAVLNQRRKMNNLAKRVQTIERWTDDKEIGRPETERIIEENMDLPYEKLSPAIRSVETEVLTKKAADQSARRDSAQEEGTGTIPSVSTERQQRGEFQLSNEVLVDLLLSIVGLTEELRQASYQDGLSDSQRIKIIQDRLDNFEIIGENGGLDMANIQKMIQNSKDHESHILFHEAHEITEVSPEEEDDEDSKRAKSSKRQGSLPRISRRADSGRRPLDSKGTSSDVIKNNHRLERKKRETWRLNSIKKWKQKKHKYEH
jgi:hypothetical protein